MANITGFRIDTDVTFSFDTGGAVPPPSSGGAPVNAMVAVVAIGQSVLGDLSIIEEG